MNHAYPVATHKRRDLLDVEAQMTITKSCGCVFCDMGLPYFVRGKDRYHEAPDGIVECTMEALSTLPIITKEQGLKMRTGKATPNG